MSTPVDHSKSFTGERPRCLLKHNKKRIRFGDEAFTGESISINDGLAGITKLLLVLLNCCFIFAFTVMDFIIRAVPRFFPPLQFHR